jgi:hypothetical protein
MRHPYMANLNLIFDRLGSVCIVGVEKFRILFCFCFNKRYFIVCAHVMGRINRKSPGVV